MGYVSVHVYNSDIKLGHIITWIFRITNYGDNYYIAKQISRQIKLQSHLSGQNQWVLSHRIVVTFCENALQK